MTTLCERLLNLGAPEEYIGPGQWDCAIQLWAAGKLSTAAFKAAFSMGTDAANELDAILATRPAAPLLLLNVPAYVQWPHGIIAVGTAYCQALGYITASQMRVGFGLSP